MYAPNTYGMFDLYVEWHNYTAMIARLVMVECVKVSSTDNTGNEIDKN